MTWPPPWRQCSRRRRLYSSRLPDAISNTCARRVADRGRDLPARQALGRQPADLRITLYPRVLEASRGLGPDALNLAVTLGADRGDVSPVVHGSHLARVDQVLAAAARSPRSTRPRAAASSAARVSSIRTGAARSLAVAGRLGRRVEQAQLAADSRRQQPPALAPETRRRAAPGRAAGRCPRPAASPRAGGRRSASSRRDPDPRPPTHDPSWRTAAVRPVRRNPPQEPSPRGASASPPAGHPSPRRTSGRRSSPVG